MTTTRVAVANVLTTVSMRFRTLLAWFISRAQQSPHFRQFLAAGYLVALIVIAFRGFWFIGELAYGDLAPLPMSVEQGMGAFGSTWQPLSRGVVFHQPVGLAFQAGLLWLTGENVQFAQLLYLGFPFVAGTVGFYVVSGRYLRSQFARALAATFFMFNPATYGFLIGGSIAPIYGHSMLPYALVLLAHGRTGSWQRTTLTALGLGFTLVIAGIHALVLWVVAGSSVGLWHLFRQQFQRAAVVILIMLFVLTAGLATNAPFYYYVITELFEPTGDLAARHESLLDVVTAAYNGPVHHSLSMSGTFSLFDQLRWITPFGTAFLAFLAVSAAMISRWDRSVLRTGLWALAVIIIVAVFMELTRERLTLFLFERIPGFLVFRAPGKLVLLVAGAFSVALAVLVDQWRHGARPVWNWGLKESSVRNLMGIVFPTALVVVLALPYTTGDGLLPELKRPTGSHRIPDAFQDLGVWLDNQAERHGEFRTLWVPFRYDDQQIKLVWVDERVAALPLGVTQVAQVPNSHSLGRLRHALCDITNGNGATQLAAAGIRYVIVDQESRTDQACDYPAHLARDEILADLQASNDFAPALVTERFRVFEVRDTHPWAAATSNGELLPLRVNHESPTHLVISGLPAGVHRVDLMEPYSDGWHVSESVSVGHLEGEGLGMTVTSDTPLPPSFTLTYKPQRLHERLIAAWSIGLVIAISLLIPMWSGIRLIIWRRHHRNVAKAPDSAN